MDGFVNGHVLRDPAAPAAGVWPQRLFASFSARLDASAALVGNLGADGPIAPRNTAVLQDAEGSNVPERGLNEV